MGPGGVSLKVREVGIELCPYPAEEHAADTLLCDDGSPCLEVGLVELCVDLTAAFDQIKRSDGSVSWAASCGC